jgi:integrase
MASTPTRVFGWIEPRYSKRKGLWNARFRYRQPDERGEQHLITIDHWDADHDLALEAAQRTQLEKTLEMLDAFQSGANGRPMFERKTIGQFVVEVWEPDLYPKLPPSSQSSDKSAINKWIRPFLGGRRFGDVNAHVAQAWVRWMEDEGASADTVKRTVAVVRGLRKRARRRGYAPDGTGDPFAELEISPPKFEPERAYALGFEDVERIGMHLPTKGDYLYLLLMGEEGLRGQEVVPLQWLDLLHEDGTARERIRVVKAVSGTYRNRVIKELKTSTGLRSPRLFAPVRTVALAAWKSRGRPALTDRVFPDPTRHDRMIEIRPWREEIFYPALLAAGYDIESAEYGKLRPHSLRAAAASAIGYAQWPRAEMIDFLGHAQETTTVRFYERAVKDAPQELRGMTIENQIARARRLAKKQPVRVKKRRRT